MTHGFIVSLWNGFEEIKEISVYNEHRPQGIAYSLYNTFFFFFFLGIYMWLFQHTWTWVCISTVLLRVWTESVLMWIEFNTFPLLLLFISFTYVCVCGSRYMCLNVCVHVRVQGTMLWYKYSMLQHFLSSRKKIKSPSQGPYAVFAVPYTLNIIQSETLQLIFNIINIENIKNDGFI